MVLFDHLLYERRVHISLLSLASAPVRGYTVNDDYISRGEVRGQVDFTDYSNETIQLVPDLVNTLGMPSGTESLTDPDALRAFLVEHEIDPPAVLSDADVETVRGLRSKVRGVFETQDVESAAEIVNSLISGSGTQPHLTDHDGHWHMHYTSMNAPIADRLGAIVGMALAALIARFGNERFGLCAASDCADVFVDTSRNRSKRYCDDTCSSRTNVAAYRARSR